jgi:hypothetical protein
LSKAENLDRELNTQKEIMKQMENQKREYINKLKKELDSVEEKWQTLNNHATMIGEDYRSQGLLLMNRIGMDNQTMVELRETIC